MGFLVLPLRIVQRLMQTPLKKLIIFSTVNAISQLDYLPSSITTSGPIVTLGPIRQPFPIFAVGSTKTLPTTPGPLYNIDGLRCFKEVKYKHIPKK